MHVTLFPCNKRAKPIIQEGMKGVILTSEDFPQDGDETVTTRLPFDMAGAAFRKYRQDFHGSLFN